MLFEQQVASAIRASKQLGTGFHAQAGNAQNMPPPKHGKFQLPWGGGGGAPPSPHVIHAPNACPLHRHPTLSSPSYIPWHLALALSLRPCL
jgi:hypothetical protein